MIRLIVALLMIALLGGCGKKEDPAVAQEQTPQTNCVKVKILRFDEAGQYSIFEYTHNGMNILISRSGKWGETGEEFYYC